MKGSNKTAVGPSVGQLKLYHLPTEVLHECAKFLTQGTDLFNFSLLSRDIHSRVPVDELIVRKIWGETLREEEIEFFCGTPHRGQIPLYQVYFAKDGERDHEGELSTDPTTISNSHRRHGRREKSLADPLGDLERELDERLKKGLAGGGWRELHRRRRASIAAFCRIKVKHNLGEMNVGGYCCSCCSGYDSFYGLGDIENVTRMDSGIRFAPGMKPEQLAAIESKFRFTFPPDIRILFSIVVPQRHDPNVRLYEKKFTKFQFNYDFLMRTDVTRDTLVEYYFSILLERIRQGRFWMESWGMQPVQVTKEVEQRCRESVSSWPLLIPFVSIGEFIPVEPCVSGNPILSITSTKTPISIIGNDMFQYMQTFAWSKGHMESAIANRTNMAHLTSHFMLHTRPVAKSIPVWGDMYTGETYSVEQEEKLEKQRKDILSKRKEMVRERVQQQTDFEQHSDNFQRKRALRYGSTNITAETQERREKEARGEWLEVAPAEKKQQNQSTTPATAKPKPIAKKKSVVASSMFAVLAQDDDMAMPETDEDDEDEDDEEEEEKQEEEEEVKKPTPKAKPKAKQAAAKQQQQSQQKTANAKNAGAGRGAKKAANKRRR